MLDVIKEKIKAVLEGRQRESVWDENGKLICDPKPLKMSAGIRKPVSREMQLLDILKRHEHLKAFNSRYEDETNFDIDEPDMLSRYEVNGQVYDMEPEVPAAPSSAPAAAPDAPPAAPATGDAK